MLDIIISWCDRDELPEAIPSLIKSAEMVNGQVYIVNYGGKQQYLRNLIEKYLKNIKLVYVNDVRYFNKSAAHNIGVYQSKNPFLFFCDNDIIVRPDEIAYITHKLQQEPDIFVTLKGVKETILNARNAGNITSFGYELKIKTANGNKLDIIDSEEDAETGLRNAPGLLCVSRENYLKINGYNGNLIGWGWEDQDMIARLTLGAGLNRIQYGEAIHISHDEESRIKFYPVNNRWESRDRMFRQALNNYDNNDFSGSYSEDIGNISVKR